MWMLPLFKRTFSVALFETVTVAHCLVQKLNSVCVCARARVCVGVCVCVRVCVCVVRGEEEGG